MISEYYVILCPIISPTYSHPSYPQIYSPLITQKSILCPLL